MKKFSLLCVGLLAVSMLQGCNTIGGNKQGPTKKISTQNSTSIKPTKTPTKIMSKGSVAVVNSVTYAPSSGVTSKVESECIIDEQLPDFIESYANKNSISVVQKDNVKSRSKGKVLTLKFTNIHGTGGGAWSGGKSVTVKGELFKSGKKIGSFIGRRSSGGGLFGAYKGTCSILGRCVETLGKDIAAWLVNPTMDARLGEM